MTVYAKTFRLIEALIEPAAVTRGRKCLDLSLMLVIVKPMQRA
jgi:hypothetical protein